MSADVESGDDAEPQDGSAGESAHVDVDPGVRRRGKRILEADPGLSPAAFAGRLFDELNTPPDVATDLYHELAEPDQSDASDDGPATADVIRDHYQRLENRDVYGALGAIDADAVAADADLSALGNQDFTGWYRSRDAGGSWDGRGRPWALAREFDDLRDGLERVLYASINYAPAPWFMDAWDRYEWVETDGEDKSKRVWEAQSSPTPGYDALHAYAPFADVDLADDVKADRPAGDVPTDRLEEALRRYIDAFADLAGGREHVYALDSVGGAYLFVAPTSTAPIATAFDADDRAAIFDELTDRLNDWLDDVAERVTDATDLAGVFEPDLLNNKNRLYKAPLSVHSSLDGVVTPVDVDDPTYQFTPLEETSGELVDETRAWVDGFTADHRDAVGAIVATLWPEHYADGDDWRDALAAWLEDHREEEARNQERERERIPSDEIPDDLETTDDLEIIKSKIDGIDVADLIDDKIGAAVEGESTNHANNDGIRFDPPWRGSESGQSCFADSVKFYDPDAKYSGGGALEFIAVERGIVSRPGDKLTGNKYWRAVNALREEGHHIPYFEGSDGRHGDVLRLFTDPETDDDRKRQLARALFADR